MCVILSCVKSCDTSNMQKQKKKTIQIKLFYHEKTHNVRFIQMPLLYPSLSMHVLEHMVAAVAYSVLDTYILPCLFVLNNVILHFSEFGFSNC